MYIGFFRLLFIALTPLTSSAANKPSCNFERIQNLHPSSIASWLHKNPTAGKGDFVCCMPKEIQNKFTITNFSISAQPGVRLLFGEMQNDNFMLSLSAEDLPDKSSEYHQQNSIEFAVNEGQRINMYDLDLTKAEPVRNPESCVGCHGNTNGAYGPAGARLVFDLEPWPRQNGGGLCRKAAAYNNILTRQAKERVKNNPDFRCLSRSAIDSVKTSIGEDQALVRIDARRIANEIMASQDYRFYKYLILGVALNCIDFVDDKVSDWIPSFAYKNMNDKLTLVKQTSSFPIVVEKARMRELDLYRQRIQEDSELILPAKNSLNRLKPLPQNLLRSCQSPSRDGERVADLSKKDELIIARWLNLQNDQLPVKEYIKDEVFRRRSFRNIKHGLFRFVFESRGIDTSSWNISLLRDERVTPMSEILPVLLRDDDFVFLSTQKRLPLFSDQESKEKICSRLKMKSRVSLDSSRFRARVNRRQKLIEETEGAHISQ